MSAAPAETGTPAGRSSRSEASTVTVPRISTACLIWGRLARSISRRSTVSSIQPEAVSTVLKMPVQDTWVGSRAVCPVRSAPSHVPAMPKVRIWAKAAASCARR